MIENPNQQWMQYVQNPRAFTIKNWLLSILKEKSSKYEGVSERLSVGLTTKEDLETFGKLIAEIYESGYLKAVNDYRQQLKDLGINVKIG